MCLKKFRSRKALEKHASQKHPGHELSDKLQFSNNNHTMEFPGQEIIKDPNEYHQYQQWLGDLVEGLNSAHNPNAPGKYNNVLDILDC